MSTSPAPLTDALDALADAARAAGLDAAQARAEGEALAAAVAEHMKGSFARWSEQTGREVSAEAFMEAALSGRRYRTSPTPLASQLLAGQPATATPYLDALTDVAAAAATLGVPTAAVLLQGYTGLIYTLELLAALLGLMVLSTRAEVRALLSDLPLAAPEAK